MLQYAAGLALLIAIGAFLIGITGGRRGKRAQYYAIRRQAHQESSRRMVFGFWSLVFAGLLFGLSWALPQDLSASDAQPIPLDTAAPVLTPTELLATPLLATEPVVAPTQVIATLATIATVLPTSVPSATPLASLPTPTLAAPTDTPVATQRSAAATPTAAVANTTDAGTPFSPSASQALALRAIGTGWGKSGELQGVANEFVTGIKTITVFYNFQNVPKGSLLRHSWLKDGKTLSFSSVTFIKPGKGTEAISWSPRGGFAPGLYEVRVALGSTQQFVANFLVR
jgi:hypothetical protein